jgi:predicted P-loop ATPase
MTRADVEKIKAFMSRTADRFRPPYEKHVVQLPRQCVFIGTSNKTEYLRDETGGRRFWPIECGKIDVAALRRDRDQLWAEALHRYNGGANWWLDTAELNAYAAEQQATRRVQDPWEAAIAEFLHERPSLEDTTISDLLEKALNVHIERQDQAAANRVARCLRVLGWSRYQIRIGEKREWRYRPRMV